MRSILVVDDNVAFAENLAEIIGDAGAAQAVVAESGARALELIATTRFAAMVTDMRMPKMSGAELIHEARRIDPGLAIIVVSAFSADDQLTTVLHEGVLSVLPKPVPMARVLALVARARRNGVVAVVDDDVALADNLAEALRDRGFAAIIAHSLAEAERIDAVPCAALVDLRLPGGADGAALIRMGERFPDLPVVVLTAFRDRVTLPSSLEVFDKPFDTRRLLDRVEKICDRQANAP